MSTRYIEQSRINIADKLLPRLKEALRIVATDTTRDDSLKGFLDVSTALVEVYTWRTLPETVYLAKFCEYEASKINGEPILSCRKAPVFDGALVGITCKVAGNDVAANGKLEVVEEFGEVIITQDVGDVDENEAYPVSVKFKAGYPLDANGDWTCPAPMQSAILNLAMHMFNNPTDCNSGGCSGAGDASNGINLPSQVAAMLIPYVLRRYEYAV